MNELRRRLTELRCSLESASAASHVSFLELNRWQLSLKGLEQVVADLCAHQDQRQLLWAHALHDIRGTVGIVRGYSELMLRAHSTDAKSRQQAERIFANAETLQQLLEELLLIFRAEVGQLRVVRTPVDLRKEIAWATEGYALACERKGLTFHCHFQEPLPECIAVDALLLRRILGNLLENAVKFTQLGGVRVEVSYQASRLSVVVADSGVGVPAELVPRIFEPYQQATEFAAQGSGLGLSVVRRLCQSLGGDATLESSCADPQRSGSVFRISVVAEAEQPRTRVRAEEQCELH